MPSVEREITDSLPYGMIIRRNRCKWCEGAETKVLRQAEFAGDAPPTRSSQHWKMNGAAKKPPEGGFFHFGESQRLLRGAR
jgi:hypothetical protein